MILLLERTIAEAEDTLRILEKHRQALNRKILNSDYSFDQELAQKILHIKLVNQRELIYMLREISLTPSSCSAACFYSMATNSHVHTTYCKNYE